MSGVAGYKTQIKIGGTPTAIVDEPLVQLSSSVFRIADPIKRVLSADYPIEVQNENDSNIAILDINYLEGIIYIDSAEVSGMSGLPFRVVTGRYIPLEYIGGSKEYSVEIAGDVYDSSAFHDSTNLSEGYKEKTYGINDVSVSLGRWENYDNQLKYAKENKIPIFVSINPGASKTSIKGWFIIETDNLSGDIGSLEDESVSLVLAGNKMKTSFSYSNNWSDTEAQAMSDYELLLNWFSIVE